MRNLISSVIHVWNTAGVASTLAKYFRKLGVRSEVIVRASHEYGFDERVVSGWKGMSEMLQSEIIHYHSRTLFTSVFFRRIRSPDAIFLRLLRKRLVFHYHGSEARRTNLRPGVPCIVSTPDLLKFVKGARWIPNPFDSEIFRPRPVEQHRGLIVGSPSPGPFAPDARLSSAIRRLNAGGYHVTVRAAEKIRHSDMPRFYSGIDVWVDKIGVNFYGVSAVEAAACGIPVVTQIGREEERMLPNCPFLNTDDSGLYSTLKSLVSTDFRRQLGETCREFAVRFHEPMSIAKKVLTFYEEVYAGESC